MTASRFIGAFAMLAIVVGVGIWSLSFAPSPTGTDAGNQTDVSADLAAFLSSRENDEATKFSGPWHLSLPRDHGAHDDAGAETWNVTAHLRDAADRPVSLTIVLTRLGASPSSATSTWGPWPIHVAQVTLTASDADLSGSDERVSRAIGTAGHDAALGEIWIDDWTWSYADDDLDLRLLVGDRPIRLRLRPESAPLTLPADDVAVTRGFALPRLSVTGTLGHGASAVQLDGTAWLDRVWGEVPLPGGPLVRDRAILHLSDGSDLSLIRTRRRDGRGIVTVDGVLVAPDDTAMTFDDGTVSFTATAEAGDTGVPTEWRIEGEGLNLSATIVAVDQLEALGQSGQIGLLSVEGLLGGQTVDGAGTLLFTPDGTS